MSKNLHFIGVLWLTCMLLGQVQSGWAAIAPPTNPQQVVREAASTVLAEITAHKPEIEANPSLIYPIVQRIIVPHFDFTRMARSAMGRFWRNTTPDQQQRLVNEFQQLLVRTYATALLGYTGQTIEYISMHASDQDTRVTVPTRISAAGGPPIPVNYRLKQEPGTRKWQVYDVVIDGVSLVTNYRSSFARLIQEGAAKASDRDGRMRAGIENLIDSLATKNAEVQKGAGSAKEQG